MTAVKPAPNARDFLHTKVETVKPTDTLADVIKTLLDHNVSNAPVVDEQAGKRTLVGFISEADCLEHVSNEMFYGNPSPKLTADKIMKRHPVCVSPDTNVFALASIFVSHGLRHLPVVEKDELVGIVSRRDVLRALEKHYRELTKQRDDERHRPDLHQIINHRFIVRGGS